MSITSVVNDNIGDSSFINAQKPIPPTISNYVVSGTDDAALLPAGGQTVLINGTGFQRGVTASISGTAIGVVTWVSANQLSFTSPASAAGTYTLYVVNSDGGTAIYVPGLIYSTNPTWTTAAGSLGSYYETQAISNTVVATDDTGSAMTYAVTSGSLPSGATLYANGLISGTAPVDSGSTTYSFTIDATDATLQSTSRSFSLTINTDVVTWVNPSNGATITLEGASYSNVLVATDAAGYSIASYTANALPAGLTLTGNTISGTPTVAGNTTTLLTATAATSNRSATNTITWVVNLGDVYWEYVTALLSATVDVLPFVDDASTNNFNITVAGDTRPNNFGPYTPGYYSNYFDGDGDWLLTASSPATLSADFTIEGWVYITSFAASRSLVCIGDDNTSTGAVFFVNTSGRLAIFGNGGNILTMTKASEDEIVSNFFKADVTYENAQGPINIKVVDPLNVKNSDFTFRFINNLSTATTPQASLNAMPTGTNPGIAALNIDNTSWELQDVVSGKKYYPNAAATTGTTDVSYETIKVGNEFYFPDLGFSVTIKQVGDPGEFVGKFTDFKTLESDYAGAAPGSFIGASISYVNGTSNWLNSIKDADGADPLNWILSGNNKTAGSEDAFYKKDNSGVIKAFYDPKKQFGNILGGTWAPYPLAASYYSISPSSSAGIPSRVFGGPGLNGKVWIQEASKLISVYGNPGEGSPSLDGNCDLRKIGSALIVFTKDKSKWTRCCVLEMQEKYTLAEGGGIFFGPRRHPSVNKDGVYATGTASSSAESDAAFISATGMGWFPGYAINLETGERLNMAFGEDSYQKENNGNDMIWNPTSNMNTPYRYAFGGKHFVYVFGGNSIQSTFPTTNPSSGATPFDWEPTLSGKPYGQTRYDYGARINDVLQKYFAPAVFVGSNSGSGLAPINSLERDIMWVSMPMPAPGFNFSSPENMPSDVRVQINVAKPYRYGFSGVATYTNSQTGSFVNKLQNVNSPSLLTADVNSTNPQNGNFPMYKFNTSDIATLFQENSTAKSALDLIKVVPNPYYGSSSYEVNRIDNRVRITNLPSKCTIKIFTMNGTLVRTITRDVSGQDDIYLGTTPGSGSDIKQTKRIPYADWDLKNQSGISVASGLYIFYVDAPGIGEKIIKWFGAMRPLDVQSY